MDSPTNPVSVFDRDYLEHLSHRDPRGPSFAEAEYAGPWTVSERDGGFAVRREAEHGGADVVFSDRETALLVAAIMPVQGRDQRFQVAPSESGSGFDVLILVGGRLEKAGWLAHNHPELIESLNIVEWLVRSPASLAKLIEAASYPVLVHAEEYLERTLDAGDSHGLDRDV